MINQAIHTVDLLQWLVGYPDTVTAFTDNVTHKGVIEVEDVADITFKRGDVTYKMYATTSAEKDNPVRIRVDYDGGEVEIIGSDVLLNGKEVELEKTEISGFAKDCYGSGHAKLISDFYDTVKSGKSFWINGEESSKAITLVLDTYESKGKTIKA
ncbi:MAG: hypothetical protein MJ072_01970 [Clostridia bacterium]|nr:hypothetical protein [Clostridia bacterium]